MPSGPLLRRFARTLTGVDLSSGMLAKAHERGVYDELAVEELVSFMRARPETYDLIVSADTLVYFGDLDSVISAAPVSLRAGGWFVFTLETLSRDTDDFVLNPHGRYSHRCEYVASTLKQNDQTISHLEPVVLRLENKQPVSGFLVIAQRGPATAHQLK